jgi:uncharacterized protein DUF429
MRSPPAHMNRSVRTVGVDLSAEDTKAYLATIDWRTGSAYVDSLQTNVSNKTIATSAGAAANIGIDCPFGWPVPFLEFITEHDRGNVRARDGLPIAWRRELVNRRTDLFTRRVTGLIPLSVSADRIAHAAMRWAALLAELAVSGVPVDRTGQTGKVVEVYPAASLSQWNLTHKSYKRAAKTAKLNELVGTLLVAASWLDLVEYEGLCRSDDYACDAVLASLTRPFGSLQSDHRAARRSPGTVVLRERFAPKPPFRIAQMMSYGRFTSAVSLRSGPIRSMPRIARAYPPSRLGHRWKGSVERHGRVGEVALAPKVPVVLSAEVRAVWPAPIIGVPVGACGALAEAALALPVVGALVLQDPPGLDRTAPAAHLLSALDYAAPPIPRPDDFNDVAALADQLADLAAQPAGHASLRLPVFDDRAELVAGVRFVRGGEPIGGIRGVAHRSIVLREAGRGQGCARAACVHHVGEPDPVRDRPSVAAHWLGVANRARSIRRASLCLADVRWSDARFGAWAAPGGGCGVVAGVGADS